MPVLDGDPSGNYSITSALETIFNPLQKSNWTVVNDDVMGGVSKSLVKFTSDHKLTFSGFLSLENNGGFASTRMDLEEADLSECMSISLRVKGDGKKYKIQLITDHLWNDIRQTFEFRTVKDTWIEITIPTQDFRPTYRGKALTVDGEQKLENVSRIGLLISDKQEGPFSIIIEWIKCSKTD